MVSKCSLKSAILHQDPNYFLLKEDESPCIFGPIEKQRWSYACAKQLIERLIYGELMMHSFMLRLSVLVCGNFLTCYPNSYVLYS